MQSTWAAESSVMLMLMFGCIVYTSQEGRDCYALDRAGDILYWNIIRNIKRYIWISCFSNENLFVYHCYLKRAKVPRSLLSQLYVEPWKGERSKEGVYVTRIRTEERNFSSPGFILIRPVVFLRINFTVRRKQIDIEK